MQKNKYFLIFLFFFVTGCFDNKKGLKKVVNNTIIKKNKIDKKTDDYYANLKFVPTDFGKYSKYLENLFGINDIKRLNFPQKYKTLEDINYFKYQFYYINKITNKGYQLYNLFNKKNICSMYKKQDTLSSLFGTNVLLFQDLTNQMFYNNFSDILNKKYKNQYYSGILILNDSKNNFSFITLKKSKPSGIELYCDAYKILKIVDWKYFKNLDKYFKIIYLFDNQLNQLNKIIIKLKDKNKKLNVRIVVSFLVKSKYNGNDLYKSLSLTDSIKKIKVDYKSNKISLKYISDIFMKVPNEIKNITELTNSKGKKIINKLIYKYNYNNNKEYYFVVEIDAKTKNALEGKIYTYTNQEGSFWTLKQIKNIPKNSIIPF